MMKMAEGSELNKWLNESLMAFPEIKGIEIKCFYRKTPKKCLGRVKGEIEIKKDIDAEALLLEGKVKKKIVRKKPKNYEIEINENLKKIKERAIRKQIVQHVIIHELLHILNEDVYKKRKKKKIHTKDFKKEVFKRYNDVRKMNKLPSISKQEDLELAIDKILKKYHIV